MWPYHGLALFFALLLPVMLLVSRAVVRQQRGAAFQDIMASLFKDVSLPQLEMVGAKYDVGHPAAGVKRQPTALLAAGLLYGLLTFLGFELLLIPIRALVNTGDGASTGYELAVSKAFIWTTGGKDAADINNAVSVVCMAFLGGYLGGARFLVRQAFNYELNGLSFVRSTLQMILGVVTALVVYRALGGPVGSMIDVFSPPPTPAAAAQSAPPAAGGAKSGMARATPPSRAPAQTGGSAAGSAAGWLGVGFLIGLSPESGLAMLTRRLRMSIQKNVEDNFFDSKDVKIIPVEIIDGIDSEIAYRLDQNNIEDIQNLATANPVQLYIETPYGLYEVFDWVLQAQLCLVAGSDVFLALKKHGIRTIFDLERAVLAENVPDGYVQGVGEVLFKNADAAFRDRLGGAGVALTADVVRHAVALILDDLHVHRLRILWKQIYLRISPDGDWIYRTSPLPGDSSAREVAALIAGRAAVAAGTPPTKT